MSERPAIRPSYWKRLSGAAPGLLLAFSLLSSASLATASIVYTPLQVDGGWASYGGFAISQDRDPYLHQADLESVEHLSGVKSLFFFDTVSNTRALYSSVWYRLLGPSWATTRALGLLELVCLLVVVAYFFRSLLPTGQLALLAVALLATDKHVVLLASSDFRPDVAQAALGCLFYFALRVARTTAPGTLALAAVAALAGMFSATAVTPVAIASVFRAAELLVDRGERRAYKLGQLAVAGVVAATCYLSRQALFHALLGSERVIVEPVSASDRIATVWAGGVSAFAEKEATRWGSYFLGLNAPLLVAFALALAAWLWPRDRAREEWNRSLAVGAAVVTAIALLVVLDPHPRPQHVVPAMPFLLLALGRISGLPAGARKLATGALVACVAWAGVLGVAAARSLATEARSVGYTNAWLADTLHQLTDGRSGTVVAGGTEFWGYFDQEADVTIVDVARSPDSIDLLGPVLPRIQYAILSSDYDPAAWIERVRRAYGVDLRIVLDKRPYVVIAEGFPGYTAYDEEANSLLSASRTASPARPVP